MSSKVWEREKCLPKGNETLTDCVILESWFVNALKFDHMLGTILLIYKLIYIKLNSIQFNTKNSTQNPVPKNLTKKQLEINSIQFKAFIIIIMIKNLY